MVVVVVICRSVVVVLAVLAVLAVFFGLGRRGRRGRRGRGRRAALSLFGDLCWDNWFQVFTVQRGVRD